ncbi:polymorphic toxin-type HINT domain-containing protein, partial [Ethanoligenens sp.]|uniref:polymorphic toxin-type HINT domain-containing protein n=1 Tax=Ethanoligenens sp. TaxID=2099655 RepID=UPI0039EA577D
NLFIYCFNNPVNMTDEGGYWPSWATKVLIGTAVILAVAVLVVATGGAGAPAAVVALNCFATGALQGAIVGAASGAGIGAASGAVGHRLKTGSWKGAGKAALNEAADGYMTGAITGAIAGGLASKACFVAGTPVLAASGLVPIETIKAGDMVYSENPETGEKGLKRVVQTFEHDVTQLVHVFVDGQEIKTTDEHPFWGGGKGWTGASHLKHGDVLKLENGKTVTVQKIQIEHLQTPVKVYNFEVEDWHTYYVSNDSILVHNMCKLNNLYSSIKNAPGYSKNFVRARNGLKKVNINNKELLEQLRQYGTGWKKVYNNGFLNGEKVSYHYFQDATGKIFDFKMKYGWN